MVNADICLEGAPNFRDFGGYQSADGRYLKRGKLFRSDTFSLLTASDFEQLASLGLRLVCDLRSLIEVNHRPTRWPEVWRPEVLHMDITADLRSGDRSVIDVLRDDPTERGAEAMMLETYRMIPEVAGLHLRELFCRLADGDALPLVIHCTAGKDRTGVFVALIQQALGVSRKDVFANYLLTHRYRDEKFEASVADAITLALGSKPLPEVVKAVADVRESYLDAALRTIDKDFGSLDNYLASKGIDSGMLNRVRGHLLE
ncbi:tyrosine-protein phosphatase [Ferribacterium limneticum]|uniref:tyrosine-protein phosphatase n=1 Tax=Ferribacterium limneticum TaxID=76259 RepID=UPI001CF8A1B7|nr:tyrosine-protein phosphatase [Ferribacterium limneticum]UCV23627.1 tyrosine-protein phosphatase [Ferribacterium limneticum]